MNSLEQPQARRPRFRLPQIRLITLLLLTACAAVWCGVWIAHREVASLDSRLAQTWRLSRELIVQDRSRLAAIRQEDTYFDENVWQLYVPKEGMRIHLATSGVNSQLQPPKLPAPEMSAELKPGMHNLELKVEEADDGWHVAVHLDMETLLELTKDKLWKPNQSSIGGSRVDEKTEFIPGQPAVLFQRVYMLDSDSGAMKLHPDGNGVVMWID